MRKFSDTFSSLHNFFDNQSVKQAIEMPIMICSIDQTSKDASSFITELSSEEINILAILMMNSWLQR